MFGMFKTKRRKKRVTRRKSTVTVSRAALTKLARALKPRKKRRY